MKNTKLERIVAGIMGILFIFIVVSMILINIRQFNIEMDADLAAEALLTRQIWEYGSIVPNSWIPSTETRIISPVQLASLIYGITHNMNLSMGISCSILLIVIIGLLIWLLRNLKFGWIDIFVVGIVLLIIPGSLKHQQIVFLFASYYAIHIIAILLTLITYSYIFNSASHIITETLTSTRQGPTATQPNTALDNTALDNTALDNTALDNTAPNNSAQPTTTRYIVFIIAIVTLMISVGLALQGMRLGLVLTCPLMVSLVVRDIWYWINNRKLPYRIPGYRNTFIFGILITIISVLGIFSPYAIPVDTSRNIRHAYEKFTGIVVPEFKEMLNLNSASSAFRKVCIITSILVIVIIIIWIIDIVKTGKAESSNSEHTISFIGLFLVASLAVSVAMCVFTTNEVAWRYFFMYYFVAAFSIGYISLRLRRVISEVCKDQKYKYVLFELIIMLVVMCLGIIGWKANLKCAIEPAHSDEEVEKIVFVMKNNDCYYGYSTFGSAGTLSVRADGRIQLAAIDDFGQMNISKWLTDKNWYCPNLPSTMKVAYVIPKECMDDFSRALEVYQDIEFVDETDHYSIYVSEINHSNLN